MSVLVNWKWDGGGGGSCSRSRIHFVACSDCLVRWLAVGFPALYGQNV